jgi:NAD+ kinase
VANVALLVHPTRPDAAALASDAVAWLEAHGHGARVLQLVGLDQVRDGTTTRALSEVDLSAADLAVSLGGDGTFLRLVPLAYAADIPVLGVNFGRLGYLLEAAPDRLKDALERTLKGEVSFDRRSAFAVAIEGEASLDPEGDRSLWSDRSTPAVAFARRPAGAPPVPDGRWWLALNEMVAERTVPGHMVRLSIEVNEENCLTYEADGVLVATPTGSTAYNLSAGGPIVMPEMAAMILTPVAPHLSVSSSLVLDGNQVVTITVREPFPAVLVVDGRGVARLSPGASVRCGMTPRPVRFVTLGERGFVGVLRSTLEPQRRP